MNGLEKFFKLGEHGTTVRTEILAGLTTFWIVEDFLWFILNPAWGFAQFKPELVTWHKHWAFGAPVDYWIGLGAVGLILFLRHRPPRARA